MTKTWLCNGHCNLAINAVEIKAMTQTQAYLEADGGLKLCQNCRIREEDPRGNMWQCKACETLVYVS
jgi:hypothetical protein